MSATAFLLGRESGEEEYSLHAQGIPQEVRQEFKRLLSVEHRFVEIKYFDTYGRQNRKRFRKNIIKNGQNSESEDFEYTGEDSEEPQKRRRGRPRKNK